MFLIRTTFTIYIIFGVELVILGVNGWVYEFLLQCLFALPKILILYFQRPFQITISNHSEEVYSPKSKVNLTFAESGKFDVNIEFLDKIRKPFIQTGLYFESDDGKYDLEVLNRTVDMCKFYKNKRYEPILQVIFKLFEDTLSHWARSCPMNKVNFV